MARIEGNLLDIQGKVTAFDILSDEDAKAVPGAGDEQQALEQLVSVMLESPVDQGSLDVEGPRYSIGFRLIEGTKVVRSFWMESGEL